VTNHQFSAAHQGEFFDPESLVVGGSDVITRPQVYAAGAVVEALTVCGRIAADGTLIKSVATADDGSQWPVAIAATAVDATTEEKTAPTYLAGEFNVEALVWDDSWELLKMTAFGDGPIVLKLLLQQFSEYVNDGYVDEGYDTP
jgi:glycerate-2-kinase